MEKLPRHNTNLQGPWTRGVWGGRTPLESGIYVIKKNFEKLFLFIGTPLDKNRSVAPANLGKNDFSPKKFLTIDYIDK